MGVLQVFVFSSPSWREVGRDFCRCRELAPRDNAVGMDSTMVNSAACVLVILDAPTNSVRQVVEIICKGGESHLGPSRKDANLPSATEDYLLVDALAVTERTTADPSLRSG